MPDARAAPVLEPGAALPRLIQDGDYPKTPEYAKSEAHIKRVNSLLRQRFQFFPGTRAN